MSSDLSPFHIGNKYFINWGRQPSDTIKLKPSTLNTAQRLVVEKMGFLYFATRVQLAKILNPGNIRRGKKNVSFLLDKGYLVEHTMTGKENNKMLPIYSLSNPARKLLGYQKFQKALTVEVLSKLMVSQFYSRFYEVDPATQMEASHVPFDALCTVRGMQFQIATLRDKGQREKVLNQIRFGDNKEKVLIVASQFTEANAFLDIKETHLFRITTDHNLLKEDLSVSFSYVENGELKSELIPPFKSRPKVVQEPIQPVSNEAITRLLSAVSE
ncbi:hypothetical protein [Paenibacillus xylanilyticus]|uniref:Uncharacterized protein n=1 Tax=Paenibacillus xylanilyticus TaxID=248903 RepID=A0A7Y6EUD8_9BACL|nr:hypothetical protein [Paenibacillus xylanilyticus]NUU74589.1 hypothetical protein [Paenibacillus xylanilyticus]